MKPVGLIIPAALALLLGSTAPTSAQQDRHEPDAKSPKPAQSAKPAQQRSPQQHGQPQRQGQKRPEQPRAETRQPSQARPPQPPGQTRQTPRVQRPAQRPPQRFGGAYSGGVQPNSRGSGGVHPSGVPQQQSQVRSGLLQSRAGSWNNEHRSWQQRGGYNGYRVPENRFGLYFGRNHFFRINRFPMAFVGGYPRFQYDGYWITFVDPWPETWAPTWYQTDDVYLDYIDDGYYLFNRMHPGIAIAVVISY